MFSKCRGDFFACLLITVLNHFSFLVGMVLYEEIEEFESIIMHYVLLF